jgi:hypothetical protein
MAGAIPDRDLDRKRMVLSGNSRSSTIPHHAIIPDERTIIFLRHTAEYHRRSHRVMFRSVSKRYRLQKWPIIALGDFSDLMKSPQSLVEQVGPVGFEPTTKGL